MIGSLLIVQMIVVRILSRYPALVERVYSNGLYPIISKGFRYALGWLPFSFGDLMYVFLIFFALRENVLLFRSRFKYWKLFLVRLFATASVVYFAFHLLWGLNYYRQPLHQSLGIEDEYTTEELVKLTQQLITKSNALHNNLQSNDSLPVAYIFAKADLYHQTLQGYEKLKERFPKLEYPPQSLKTSLLSYPLSVMGYSGYLNPVTNEAQVNGMVPQHRLPVISCHEQAHQLGFAKENEANFIAVMATLANEDPYFQYSGSIFALRYCLNDIYQRDKELGEALHATVRPGILAQYQLSRDFWDKMDNPLEPIFDLFYSNYLKSNNQPAGLQSYSYMVALLVSYEKRFPEAL